MVEKLTPKKDISNYVNKHLKDTKIIKKNDQVIGGVIYYKENSRYLLDLIYIKDKYQNLGIGHNIIKNLIDNQKKKKTQLEVLKSNIKAIKLYKNLGFQIISETKNKYIMEVN